MGQWGECLVVAAQVYNHFSEVDALYVIYIQPSLHIPFTVHMFYVQSLMTSFVGKSICFSGPEYNAHTNFLMSSIRL